MWYKTFEKWHDFDIFIDNLVYQGRAYLYNQKK